jgi:hypothetical protein
MTNTTDTRTGISATAFTLPDGRELPAFNIDTEGDELYAWLVEIDRTMENTPWGAHGDQHKDWYHAWTQEFFRIRKAMGVFDPYKF